MSHFERFERESDEYFSKQLPEPHWYGKKEVPNIILTLVDFFDTKEPKKILLSVVTQYYESYDSEKGWKAVIELPLLSPAIYERLTCQYRRYEIELENYWRSNDTGKDEGFHEPVKYFDHMRIEHKLSCEGDPAKWYITLWQDREKTPPKQPATLKEVEL